MGNFGDRLKEERERLGLSQAKFAEACGVGKTAQFNYETNARTPDADYLQKAGALGADIGYMLSGDRTTPNNMFYMAETLVLPYLAEKAGFNAGALLWILERAAQMESWNWGGPGLNIKKEDIFYLIDELFIFGDLLDSIVRKVGDCLHKSGKSLSMDKEYALVTMLFRSFKLNAKIDEAMIEGAVNLATS